MAYCSFFFFQAEDGIRDVAVTGVQTCALPICTQLSTRELAVWLQERMQQGEDLAFLIGGPDGLAPQVLARGNFTLSLSRLTLPHALARVLLAEQLYRAHSILTHHPYHRD